MKNKEQLNTLMKGLGGAAMKFIRRSGIYFGFAIGLVQMVAWGYFHNPWIMPAFGFFTGFFSDWLALNLIFIPRERKKLFCFIPIHRVLHAEREQVTRDYAKLLATTSSPPTSSSRRSCTGRPRTGSSPRSRERFQGAQGEDHQPAHRAAAGHDGRGQGLRSQDPRQVVFVEQFSHHPH